jgi:Ran-interacting Mog1 protein
MNYSVKKLYGEAIEASMLSRLNSLGDILPIPDVQEVFSDPENNCSYIIELLEKVEAAGPDAIATIFQDIVEANESTANSVTSQAELNDNTYMLEGYMTVNQKKVFVYLLLIRIPNASTDLSFYISDPDHLAPEEFRQVLTTFMSTFKIIDNALFINN